MNTTSPHEPSLRTPHDNGDEGQARAARPCVGHGLADCAIPGPGAADPDRERVRPDPAAAGVQGVRDLRQPDRAAPAQALLLELLSAQGALRRPAQAPSAYPRSRAGTPRARRSRPGGRGDEPELSLLPHCESDGLELAGERELTRADVVPMQRVQRVRHSGASVGHRSEHLADITWDAHVRATAGAECRKRIP
jgi:hypothetical protein